MKRLTNVKVAFLTTQRKSDFDYTKKLKYW